MFLLAVYLAVPVVCVFAALKMIALYRESLTDPTIDGSVAIWILLPVSIVFLEFAVLLLRWLLRKLNKQELFTISPSGLHHIYTVGNFLILWFMTSAKTVPWDAVVEFKLTTYVGRKYIVMQLDTARLPGGTSGLFRLLAVISNNGRPGGFYFGSRSAAEPPEALLKKLNAAKKEYGRK